MFDLGMWELMLVGLVALLVLGPEKLPKAARMAGYWVRRARQSWYAVRSEIERELAAGLRLEVALVVLLGLFVLAHLLTAVADVVDGPLADFLEVADGARMERLNWLADTSTRGMRQAAGLMINYLYKLDEIDGNHEGYKGDGAIAVSSAIRNLSRKMNAC